MQNNVLMGFFIVGIITGLVSYIVYKHYKDVKKLQVNIDNAKINETNELLDNLNEKSINFLNPIFWL